MLTKDNIAEAARYADARAEELGLPGWCAAYDIELDGLAYVANQRALRAGIAIEGRDPRAIDQTRMSLVRIKRSTEQLMPALAATWMDGFAAGFTAQRATRVDLSNPNIRASLEAIWAVLPESMRGTGIFDHLADINREIGGDER